MAHLQISDSTMKIKAVIFSVDEVILELSKTLELFLWWNASDYLNLLSDDCEKYAQRFTELNNNAEYSLQDVYTILIKDFGIYEYTAEHMLQLHTEALPKFSVERRHAPETVSALRSHGLKTGVITNGSSPLQENKLEALGLTDFFDTILISETVGLEKPQPEIFTLACKHLEVAAEECVFVGDDPVADIEGANNAGMFSVFVPTRRYPGCGSANHICRDLRDLISVVIEASEQLQNK